MTCQEEIRMSEIIEYSSLCFLFWFGGPSALSSSHIQALGLVAVTGRSEQLSCHSQTARSQPRGRVAACNQGSSTARPVPAVARGSGRFGNHSKHPVGLHWEDRERAAINKTHKHAQHNSWLFSLMPGSFLSTNTSAVCVVVL